MFAFRTLWRPMSLVFAGAAVLAVLAGSAEAQTTYSTVMTFPANNGQVPPGTQNLMATGTVTPNPNNPAGGPNQVQVFIQ